MTEAAEVKEEKSTAAISLPFIPPGFHSSPWAHPDLGMEKEMGDVLSGGHPAWDEVLAGSLEDPPAPSVQGAQGWLPTLPRSRLSKGCFSMCWGLCHCGSFQQPILKVSKVSKTTKSSPRQGHHSGNSLAVPHCFATSTKENMLPSGLRLDLRAPPPAPSPLMMHLRQ